MSENQPVTHHGSTDSPSRAASRDASRITHHVSAVLSCAVIGAGFWGLWQVDLPLTRFLRSVHLPWLELVGDIGNRLGSGWILAGISGMLLAIGLALKQPVIRRAGLEGLIAHGAVALVVQGLKHLIGRPRPRMMHGNGFQLGPSLDSGLDSFPSGHVTASFAIAAVLARHFPGLAWLVYGAAGLVAVSRVVRGSHFPTDVAGGMVLGVLVGSLVANFQRGWWSSLVTALTGLSPYLVAFFTLLWIAVHSPPEEPLNSIMVGVGTLLIALGIGGRLYWLRKSQASRLASRASRLLSWVGLAVTSGSVAVTALAVLASAVQVMMPQQTGSSLECATHPSDSVQPSTFDLRKALAEGAFALGLAFAVAVLQGLKGIIPIL
ncbi:MAG: phosphatase PAP2 family protein [Nitrospiraceae bacterium]